jgi:hypothetical protein
MHRALVPPHGINGAMLRARVVMRPLVTADDDKGGSAVWAAVGSHEYHFLTAP